MESVFRFSSSSATASSRLASLCWVLIVVAAHPFGFEILAVMPWAVSWQP